VNDIAGVCNADRNVVGLMPHPERACESRVGSDDGQVVLRSVVKAYADGLISRRPAFANEAPHAVRS
jgi:phosphoribosylformylglycinamidine synthase subunit PurQ / glutaminase